MRMPIPIILLALAGFVACDGDSPSKPCFAYDPVTGQCVSREEPPPLCPFRTELRTGLPGSGTVEVSTVPPGECNVRVNGLPTIFQHGNAVLAERGDNIACCRQCGCSEAVQW